MFGLPKVFQGLSKDTKTKDAVAKLLKTSPAALEAFEKTYAEQALNKPEEDLFQINSRQASAQNRVIDITAPQEDFDATKVVQLEDRIVDELLAQTTVWEFDGILQVTKRDLIALPEGNTAVTQEDVAELPKQIRPQLTGNLMTKDLAGDTFMVLLENYERYLHGKDKSTRTMAYHMFRQGLDILDLDGITYDIIDTNKNSMGHWLPQLVDACSGQDFFKIPATKIVKVPLTLLQLTRCEYGALTQTTLNIVDKWAMQAFGLDVSKDYFIKTGTYSSKFDFRNAKVTGEKEVRELGEYLLYIHFQALQMASPLTQPASIYGVSTTTEWIVRDYIEDKENCPRIYKGMPLHTEYRFFIDCDTDKIIGYTPYWEPDTMKKRFSQGNDANSPHQVHDYVIYKAYEETLMERYAANFDTVWKHLSEILPSLDLKGQWSIDIMQNGDDFWIIDMALAEQSAFYKFVPANLRNPMPENWLPELPKDE